MARSKAVKKNWTLKKNFGITLEDYDRMYAEQKGSCAICGRYQSQLSKFLGVDHNHETNAVRGLLCRACNAAIGLLQDKVKMLESAAKYLRKHGG
jgi:hypothetical protein